MNGWYPDPGGEPGRYRYWDGSSWSATTSENPSDGPPGPGSDSNRPGSRSRLGLLLGIVALVVIVVVVANVLRGGPRPTTEDPLPSTTVSGGDDRSPTPPPTVTPSASPNAEAPCPVGNPNRRAPHPADGRVYGGNLSFATEPTFDRADAEVRFSFAHDVVQQVHFVHQKPGWIAQLAVGEVRSDDGFGPKTRNAAEIVVQCAVTSQLYDPYQATRRDIRSEAIIVDGHAGWVIESQVLVGEPGLPFPGDRSIFILVPNGKNWGLFFGAVPIGDKQLGGVLNRAVRSLRVT